MAALANLVTRGFARVDRTHPVPLCNIVMSSSVLDWALGTLAGQTEPGDHVPVDANHINGRCELIDGTPIHPFLAVQALGLVDRCQVANPVHLRRYVMDSTSRMLDVSVTARIFPEWMRTAALIQTRGTCSHQGCDAPYNWLQIDHVEPHSTGGEPRFDNAAPSCRPDNQAKGATTGHTHWQRRQPPPRRNPRRTQTSGTAKNADPDDPTDDPDHQPDSHNCY